MKEDYYITIDNTQTSENDSDHITLTTLGEYTVDGCRKRIRYADSDATGFNGCETVVNVDEEGIVFQRLGSNTAQFILRQGKRYTGHYGTPFGDMTLGIYTDRISDRLDEHGGRLEFSYSLDINAAFLSKNELKITVREKKKNV